MGTSTTQELSDVLESAVSKYHRLSNTGFGVVRKAKQKYYSRNIS